MAQQPNSVVATRTVSSVQMADSLHNLLSGMGGSGDKVTGAMWHFIPMDRQQLEAAYRSDWIARKVIDIPAFDAARSWRNWQADKKDITKIETVEKQFVMKRKLMSTLQKARLYGGAALIMGINQGKPEDEVKLDAIKKGDLKFVHVVSRNEITAGQLITDIESPWYGEPSYYERQVSGSSNRPVRLHPSRVVRLLGLEPPDMFQSADQGWGDPVLQVVSDAIRSSGIVNNGIAALVDEAKIDVISIPGLTENIMDPVYEQRIRKRFGLASDAKSIYRMLLLDKEENWERITQSFSQLPEIMQMYMVLASGAADIPVTRMMGEAPKGLNATGVSDIRNYYDMVNTKQTMDIGPPLERLDEVLIRSALGAKPEEIFYEWVPLWQMDEATTADVSLKKAQSYKVDVDSAIIPPEVLKKARENQLIEDGTYPGLETIIEEYEADVEAGLIADPNDPANQPVPPVIDPKTGLPVPPDPKALPPKPAPLKLVPPVKKAIGDSTKRIRRAVVTDALPRTLYVRRDVTNWQALATHFKSQGFKTTVGASMHVTLAFSRQPVDWMKAGEAWGNDKDGGMHIVPGGVRIVEKFQDATVLLFVCNELAYRWCSIKDNTGAEWKWPDYQPHITISYEGAPGALGMVQPYVGAIELGPEIFEEINTDYADLIVEDAKAHKLWGYDNGSGGNAG